MNTNTGGIFDFPAKRSVTQQREWNQHLEYIDRADDDDDGPAAPIVGTPPVHPSSLRIIERYSPEEQDAWSDRMRARYGGEW